MSGLNLGFARRGRAALSLTSLSPLHGNAFAAWRDFERAAYEWAEHWAPGPIRASSFGEGLRPPQRRSALAWRRLRRLAHHCPRRPALGPEPRRVSSRPDPGLPAPAALPILRAGRLRPPPPLGPFSLYQHSACSLVVAIEAPLRGPAAGHESAAPPLWQALARPA